MQMADLKHQQAGLSLAEWSGEPRVQVKAIRLDSTLATPTTLATRSATPMELGEKLKKGLW